VLWQWGILLGLLKKYNFQTVFPKQKNMQESYSKNYLKIYFFQILSIVLGFLSLFVVVPYLSADKSTYGIYSICISVTVFLSYADLGFLGAGMKYAAESFSKNNREEEMKLIGFTHFILLFFIAILCLSFLYLSFNPSVLIKAIQPGIQTEIAFKLLLILAFFSPTIILQRILQTIFSIRLQDYILQRINIVGNLTKILSVFYFFGMGKYDIVNYFLFLQIVNLVCAIVGIFKAKKQFDYDFIYVIKQLKYNKEIFDKTKALAFSGLFVTISWILYYEIDSFSIGRLLGAEAVAIYAIGFTVLSFFRSLLGVFFSPFSARFNHFIGEERHDELKSFYLNVMTLTFPIVVFPIIAVIIFAKPIVISWVGENYTSSIEIVRWLVLCNILAFISYPAGMLMVAHEKLKVTYFLNFCLPFIYWFGIYLTINKLGVSSFALFKCIVFAFSGIVYFWYSLNFLKISIFEFFKKCIMPYIPAILFIIIALYFARVFFVTEKSKINLFINATIMGVSIIFAMGLSLFTVKPLKDYFFKTLNSLRK
jgi:O-antigen/teichoic acid export membrane protein